MDLKQLEILQEDLASCIGKFQEEEGGQNVERTEDPRVENLVQGKPYEGDHEVEGI